MYHYKYKLSNVVYVKAVGANQTGTPYGYSMWGIYNERKLLGLSIPPFQCSEATPYCGYQDITSAYVPEKGDVIQFGTWSNDWIKGGVVTTKPAYKAATRTKPAGYKFKIIEMNARCDNRKTTKSITMTDSTQITSADGTTKATKYFRN